MEETLISARSFIAILRFALVPHALMQKNGQKTARKNKKCAINAAQERSEHKLVRLDGVSIGGALTR
jgi:hypothetical protein